MVRVYLVSEPGTASGIPRIIAAIQEFRNQLLFVLRVHHSDRYSFIAIFREQGSVGSFTALIDQGGATSGYNGGGPWAHAQMLTCLDDNKIELQEAYWRDWESDYPEFTSQVDELGMGADYTGELAEVWSDFLSYYIWYSLPRAEYKPSDKWLREVGYNPRK